MRLGEIGFEKVDFEKRFQERFRRIRAQKMLNGSEMAAFFEGNKHDWSHLETGKTKSLAFVQIEDLCQKGKIDPRYLFGFEDSAEQADLEKHPLKKPFWDDLLEQNKKLKALVVKLHECPDHAITEISVIVDKMCAEKDVDEHRRKASGH